MAKSNYGKAKERTEKTASVERATAAAEKKRETRVTFNTRIPPDLMEAARKINRERQYRHKDAETLTDIAVEALASYVKKYRGEYLK